MNGVRVRLSVLVLASCVAMACGPRPQTDLTARILFAATGTYDAQADHKQRLGAGRRRAVWRTRPPLPVNTLTVEYNSEARPAIWALTLEGNRFPRSQLLGENPAPREVEAAGAPAQLFTSGRLRGVLLRPVPGGVQLLTRAYVTQYESTLLSAFQTP
ncbi:hypothetical protein [Deinococcus navajonensis]|uniref:CHRD domain-containing protein n=1 Tax=Deinococcus navajonensis TaxID=309884 RepID=A0ABV8XRZ2_9DEIO